MNNLQKENLEKLLKVNQQLNGVKKPLKENIDDDFFDDIPDDYTEFDSLEFKTNAKNAAIEDIEKEFGKNTFQDIGKNKYEKGKTEKEFSDEVDRANLDLPSDKKELERIKKMQSDKEDHENKFGKGSLNETLNTIANQLYEYSETLLATFDLLP